MTMYTFFFMYFFCDTIIFIFIDKMFAPSLKVGKSIFFLKSQISQSISDTHRIHTNARPSTGIDSHFTSAHPSSIIFTIINAVIPPLPNTHFYIYIRTCSKKEKQHQCGDVWLIVVGFVLIKRGPTENCRKTLNYL